MKKKQSFIVTATAHFYSNKFRRVIRLLEPEIFRYRENFQFYYLLGLSYLYSGDMDGAESFLKRAIQMDEENLTLLEGLALVNFKKGKTDQALADWLEILELDPKNKNARRGLNLLRGGIEPSRYLDNELFKKLLPRVKKKSSFKPLLIILVSLLLVLSIPAVFLIIKQKNEHIRPGMEVYSIPEIRSGLVELPGSESQSRLYVLTSKEIEESFAKAKKYFNEYRDNLAQVEINRILNSNAAGAVKEMARLMQEHVQIPDFSNIRDSFDLRTVLRTPVLYNGCYVLWAGKVGNLEIGDTRIAFELWVGSETEFEGVVPVILSFASDLANGMQIRVLGRVSTVDGQIKLTGRAIHKQLIDN